MEREHIDNKIVFQMIIFVAIVLIITIVLLTGCTSNRETGTWIKEGRVINIEYDDAFGGTFTDWKDNIYFDDRTVLWSQDRDLSSIRLNQTGTFYFEKNHFKYEGAWYKFDNFIRVEYYDMEI